MSSVLLLSLVVSCICSPPPPSQRGVGGKRREENNEKCLFLSACLAAHPPASQWRRYRDGGSYYSATQHRPPSQTQQRRVCVDIFGRFSLKGEARVLRSLYMKIEVDAYILLAFVRHNKKTADTSDVDIFGRFFKGTKLQHLNSYTLGITQK